VITEQIGPSRKWPVHAFDAASAKRKRKLRKRANEALATALKRAVTSRVSAGTRSGRGSRHCRQLVAGLQSDLVRVVPTASSSGVRSHPPSCATSSASSSAARASRRRHQRCRDDAPRKSWDSCVDARPGMRAGSWPRRSSRSPGTPNALGRSPLPDMREES
jgi:hypothetical protein